HSLHKAILVNLRFSHKQNKATCFKDFKAERADSTSSLDFIWSFCFISSLSCSFLLVRLVSFLLPFADFSLFFFFFMGSCEKRLIFSSGSYFPSLKVRMTKSINSL